ncbi:MAG TPA: metallophosphoesterase, partial [Chloroflexota bacterium]|nr:metallophosphoesterase [Chloroflexota bacterium]
MYPHRLEERRAWLRRGFSGAVDHAMETGAQLFLIAGDLFDSPEPRNAEREFVAEALARLRSAGVRCLAISGNHDTPRSRGSQPPATPLGSYAPLGGMRLLRGRGEIDTELLEIADVRVAVGGMTPDPTLPPGSDPLDGVTWDPQADLAILLLHGGLEGHIYPGASEAILRRATVEALGADCLLVGHVHKHAAFRWGERTVVVPGATERMTFGDLGSQPGFVEMV